jgi:hypothetical protein
MKINDLREIGFVRQKNVEPNRVARISSAARIGSNRPAPVAPAESSRIAAYQLNDSKG